MGETGRDQAVQFPFRERGQLRQGAAKGVGQDLSLVVLEMHHQPCARSLPPPLGKHPHDLTRGPGVNDIGLAAVGKQVRGVVVRGSGEARSGVEPEGFDAPRHDHRRVMAALRELVGQAGDMQGAVGEEVAIENEQDVERTSGLGRAGRRREQAGHRSQCRARPLEPERLRLIFVGHHGDLMSRAGVGDSATAQPGAQTQTAPAHGQVFGGDEARPGGLRRAWKEPRHVGAGQIDFAGNALVAVVQVEFLDEMQGMERPTLNADIFRDR